MAETVGQSLHREFARTINPEEGEGDATMTKTILITGASTGFGRDTDETLASAGHTVFASMRDPEARNRAHADALGGQNIEVLELDVTDSESVDRAVAAVIAKEGRMF